MSRFMLDCASSRPVDADVAQWLAMAATRAWAPVTGGYHEAKISQALLQQAAQTVATATGGGGGGAWFAADPTTAVAHAVLDVLTHGVYEVVVTGEADAIVLQQSSASAAAQAGVAHAVVGVDSRGRLLDLPDRAVVVTGAVNQEIGTVQPDFGDWAAACGSAVVLDATSAWGWLDLPYWDRLIFDPRAVGATAGAVAVVSRDNRRPVPFDNVPAAVAAGLAMERWQSAAPTDRITARRQVKRIVERIRAEVPDVQIHGGKDDDAPHILSISVLYIDAEALQTRLDAQGYAVGSGSACASRSGQPSHVLSAIGALTSGNVRLGLPPGLPEAAVEAFIDAFVAVVAQVRREMGTQDL